MATTNKASTEKKSGTTASKRSGTVAKGGTAPKTKSAAKPAASKTAASKKTSGSNGAKRSATTSAKTSSSSKGRSNGKSKGIISSVVDKVSGMFSSTSASATDLLKADHKKVSALFDKVKANEDGNNVPTFRKIKAELDTHTHIEETVFYPYLIEKGDKELKDITREGIEEHAQAKQVLADLAAIAGDTPKFKAKLKVLMEDIEHHVKEEENEMFPMVEDQFSGDVLAKLGQRLEQEKQRFQGKAATETDSSRKSMHAR